MYNRYVFGGCALIGFLIGRLLGTGAVAAYASVMVAYHLYLGFLIVSTERKSGMKLPFVGRTFLIHLACLVPLIGLAMARPYIPVFAIIRLLTLGLAIAEVKWLFKGHAEESAKQTARVLEAITGTAVAAAPVAQASASAAAVVASSVATSAPITETPVASSFAVTAPEAPVPVSNAFAEATMGAAEPVATVPVAALPVATYSIAATPELSVPVATYSVAPAPVETIPVASVPVATYSFATSTVAEPAPVIAPPSSDAGADPYDEFVKHMQQGKRPFRKPGVSVKEEFDLWLAARAKSMTKPAPQRSGLSRFAPAGRSAD
jgi:hypothetical protein